MFERFTDRARRVLVLAQEEARLLNHGFIGTEHILLGLVHEGDGLAAKALESLDISLEAVREKVVSHIGPALGPPAAQPPFTPRAKKVLELSLREALQLGHNYIGTEHLLLGLVREGEGVGAQVLIDLCANLERVRVRVTDILGAYQGEAGAPSGGATLRQMQAEGASAASVGRHWTAQVVRAGRRPDDYARAYQELSELVELRGLTLDELDPSEITLLSIETADDGPGILLCVKHLLEGGPAGEPDEPSGTPDAPDPPSS